MHLSIYCGFQAAVVCLIFQVLTGIFLSCREKKTLASKVKERERLKASTPIRAQQVPLFQSVITPMSRAAQKPSINTLSGISAKTSQNITHIDNSNQVRHSKFETDKDTSHSTWRRKSKSLQHKKVYLHI